MESTEEMARTIEMAMDASIRDEEAWEAARRDGVRARATSETEGKRGAVLAVG